MALTELIESLSLIGGQHGDRARSTVSRGASRRRDAPAAVVLQRRGAAAGESRRRRLPQAGRRQYTRAEPQRSARVAGEPRMTLWSGRSTPLPIRPPSISASRSASIARSSKTTSPAASRGRRRSAPPACCRPRTRARSSSALEAILDEGRRNPALVAGPDEDVHSFVERQLIERIGDAGRRLHTGRSRNEQVSLDLRLYLRRRIPLLQQARRRRSSRRAPIRPSAAGTALMPSYTHLRRAQPVLVAHFFLSHASALRRDSRAAGGRGRRGRRADARLGRDCRHELSGRHRACSPARSASRASCSTAWTPRPIATSSRRSSTPRRWRWCISAGWPRT